MTRITIWRGPDGRHWQETGSRHDKAAGGWLYRLTPAAQDPETGRWAASEGKPIEVTLAERRDTYTEVSDNPLGDPRIALLHTLTHELLTDYETQHGHPHPRTTELRLALEDVAYIPKEARRRRLGAVMQARRH